MQRMAREPRFVTARDGLHTPSSSSTSRTGLTDSEARSSVGPFIAGSFKCFLGSSAALQPRRTLMDGTHLANPSVNRY